ncbi:phosphohydrolase [bacterium]|nr:phosphohydrolase [bacterium]
MKPIQLKFFLYLIAWLFLPSLSFAHVDGLPSVHDIVAQVRKELVNNYPPNKLLKLEPQEIWEGLTDEQKTVFSTAHIRLTVNVPVTLHLFRDVTLGEEPLWLKEQGFEPTEYKIVVDDEPFDGWKKSFEAGRIGLGVNSFQDEGEHYFMVLVPQNAGGDSLAVSKLYPGQCRVATLKKGVRPYTDDDDPIVSLPADLEGATLIRVREKWVDTAAIMDYFHQTRFPSSQKPDQIVLTWSEDPQTTQTIQWRTSPEVKQGVVAYQKQADYNRFNPKRPMKVKAETEILETADILNDPVCHRHHVTLRNLEPDTPYVYSVGDGSEDGWSELAEFTTAPDRVVPFSFIYMGDAQNGLDRWGSLAQNAFRERPDAAFYVMAGDLVNRGNERWDWDDFFYNAKGIFNNRQLAPAIGNHENQDGHPHLYLDLFHLAENGPDKIENERAYAFEYSNAKFIILDSNLSPQSQQVWLEEQLANTNATWKFVVYHHPAYSSKPNRDNQAIREFWTPLFDKYHVDMALQGHDHAYLRTYPMHEGKKVKDPEDGTIYIVSVSGVKMYDQAERDYTAFGMTNVSTYQVLDIQIVGDRLVYRSYDIDGNLRDTIVIEK